MVGSLIMLCFSLPIVNFTLRFLMYLFYYIFPSKIEGCLTNAEKYLTNFNWKEDVIKTQDDDKKTSNKLLYVLPIVVYMLSAALILVFVFECSSFYIECGLYIVVGIVLNSDRIMKFISLSVLIAWYAFDYLDQ